MPPEYVTAHHLQPNFTFGARGMRQNCPKNPTPNTPQVQKCSPPECSAPPPPDRSSAARDVTGGLQLAFSDINAAGGLNGRLFHLVTAKYSGDPAPAVAALLDRWPLVARHSPGLRVCCFPRGCRRGFCVIRERHSASSCGRLRFSFQKAQRRAFQSIISDVVLSPRSFVF